MESIEADQVIDMIEKIAPRYSVIAENDPETKELKELRLVFNLDANPTVNDRYQYFGILLHLDHF